MNSLQNRSTLLDKQYDTGQFSACIVTNIGKEMIAKSQNGQTLTFTRVALGDGLIDDDDDILSFTKVKNERLSANIAKWVDKQNGQFQIQFRVSNQEVETGFWQREIGIMAKVDGGEEQLYAYATSGNGADFLYDKTTPIDERIVNIDFVIGNAENVQVIVNGSIIYATIEDLENAIDEHNADENAHDNLIKRLFGSAEATLDSIKLKIKEWAKEACLPLSGGTMKGNINANGYNITATKFIGNLQGKADSAANADLAAKATTAENANNSSVANKLGTSTVGSATKPVYINNGVASAVSVDLSTLAPKASPGLTGTPTAPTANVDTNDTQLATCAFVRNAISKYSSKDIDVLKKIMHVGYIHFSTVNINPAELFGFGTWEAMPAGRVLLAQGTASWGTYNAGSTGGEATHQLTVGEMPTVTPEGAIALNVWANDTVAIVNGGHTFSGSSDRFDYRRPSISGTASFTGKPFGSNQAHNNIQPYISCYIWKRIS